VTSYAIVNVTIHLTSSSPAPTETSTPVILSSTISEVVSQVYPTRCVVVVTDLAGKLITIATNIPGKCATPTSTPTLVQDIGTTSRPTIYVIEAIGCVTDSKDAEGKMVMVASNPPVSGTCPTPAFVPPATSKPTVYITEAIGCITVYKDANGQMVTVASNPPVNEKCATPTYVAPYTSNTEKTTVYKSPS
jgi:hypothetical protein